MATIGQRIKELRESLGLSVDEFARAIQIHRSSAYRYEESNPKEIRDVPMSVAIKIAEKYNVSLDWLSGASDIKYRDYTPNRIMEVYKQLSPKRKQEAISYLNYLKAKEDKYG